MMLLLLHKINRVPQIPSAVPLIASLFQTRFQRKSFQAKVFVIGSNDAPIVGLQSVVPCCCCCNSITFILIILNAGAAVVCCFRMTIEKQVAHERCDFKIPGGLSTQRLGLLLEPSEGLGTIPPLSYLGRGCGRVVVVDHNGTVQVKSHDASWFCFRLLWLCCSSRSGFNSLSSRWQLLVARRRFLPYGSCLREAAPDVVTVLPLPLVATTIISVVVVVKG
mmetsp:Transcript_19526/g.45644  ORF Transcript_19526/g.45644 Transcript_19526/m.45644 type:complete len:221 (-) Transcript_19526:143-805(-)